MCGRWILPATCRRRRLARVVVGLLATFAATPAIAAPGGALEPKPSVAGTPADRTGDGCGAPQSCFARMVEAQRGVARIRAGFRQTKHVALLSEPLVSTGRFSFERPDRVRWEMVTPEPLVVEIAGGTLRAGPPGAVADVDAGPAVGLFRDLGTIFTGASDYADEQRFAPGPGATGPWSFILTPRDPAVARVIRTIGIELDPVSGGPRRVAIDESTGDRTEIELLEVRVERAAGEGAAP